MREVLITAKGLLVGFVALVTPLEILYLFKVTNGVSSFEEYDNFYHAGEELFCICAGMIAAPIAIWLWLRVREIRPWATIMFLAPSAVLVFVITIIVIQGDCLDADSLC